MKEIKVLIGDNTAEYGVKLAAILRDQGYYTLTRKSDGNVILDSILKHEPDVVISDLELSGKDAIAVMREVKNMTGKDVKFIITSKIKNSFLERQAIDNGASFFVVRPFETEILNSLLKAITYSKESAKQSNDLEIVVTDIIHRLGIPAHIKGYHYLRTAIIETFKDEELMSCVTKKLYPTVAEKYGTTPTRVERAIRHAIDVSWARGNTEVLNSVFGYTVDTYRGKPTNSEFIALITDRLRLSKGNNFIKDDDGSK
ncbi:MAG: sporulation transcription factor Spo0A [Ruminococcus sp.]|nr:sporulation transcription factor Spo0A [Ruminococcus sp.]